MDREPDRMRKLLCDQATPRLAALDHAIGSPAAFLLQCSPAHTRLAIAAVIEQESRDAAVQVERFATGSDIGLDLLQRLAMSGDQVLPHLVVIGKLVFIIQVEDLQW